MHLFILRKRSLKLFNFLNFFITFVTLICIYISYSKLQSYVTIDASTYVMGSIEIKEFYDKVNNLMKNEEKIAYLTFDDGPTTSVTPKILDILKEEDVKATFFVIGKKVEENPEIVKREYQEGHYIANHGYSHNNNILYKNKESFIYEVEKTEESIRRAIKNENYSSHIFRFPNGYMSSINKKEKIQAAKILSEMNYTHIDWNCLNNDSMKKYTPNQLVNNLKESCKDKNTLVILMHDTKDVSDSSLVLTASIRYLKEQGYTFQNFYKLFE